MCGELFGHEASTCCNRSEKRFTHAVTWPHMAAHTHTHTHTRIQTQRRTCKSTQALHTHTPAVSLIDRLQERNIYTHTHSLSVNTSLRLVGGKHSPASDFSLDHVQGSGRNVLIASAFVHTHTQPDTAFLSDKPHTLYFTGGCSCTCKYILLTVKFSSDHFCNTSEE